MKIARASIRVPIIMAAVIALFAAMAIALFAASSAEAGVPSVQEATITSVQAGGTGDFYKGPFTCKADKATTATSSTTNYDKGTGQEVHTSMKAGYIDGRWWTPEVVYVNDVKRPASEAYTYIADKRKIVNVLFVWGRGFADRTCELYIL